MVCSAKGEQSCQTSPGVELSMGVVAAAVKVRVGILVGIWVSVGGTGVPVGVRVKGVNNTPVSVVFAGLQPNKNIMKIKEIKPCLGRM